jgi:hypothetical protein
LQVRPLRSLAFLAAVAIAASPASARPQMGGPCVPGVEALQRIADGGLMSKAEAAGSVRVIATLNLPFRDPASLSEAELSAQTARLHQAQEEVIERVLGDSREDVTTFDFVPSLALSVTPAQLEKLLQDPAVAAVQEDALATPSTPQAAPAPSQAIE